MYYTLIMFSISDISLSNDAFHCVISNCNTSVVNAIRRTILSDVETVTFNTTDYKTSDLTVIKNTSSLHNEFLLHRLGMIPINIPNIDTFNPDNYKFILNKKNDGTTKVDVTTADFSVINLNTGNKEDTLQFFPPNKITGDNILITILKNNPNGEGEHINIEGKSSIGSGKQNSRFSPVSNVLFINKRDDTLAQKAFSDQIQTIQPSPNKSELVQLAKTFDIEEADRYFYTDDDGNPNVFEFTIESIGVIPPNIIFKQSIKKIIEKLNTFLRNLSMMFDSKPSDISIKESDALMDGYDLIIDNENHTLGFLLQSYINKLNENIFVGYMNPHPLEKKIMIRINISDINKLKTVLETCVTYLIDAFNTLLNTLK